MSQIVLDPKTRDVLELVIPEWTEKLTSVNFDGRKLESLQQEYMGDCSKCYIGELHKENKFYDDCDICLGLSQLAPHVFKIDVDEANYNKIIEEIKSLGFGDLEDSNVTVDKFLKYVADHIQNKHRDIMKKCEVSK